MSGALRGRFAEQEMKEYELDDDDGQHGHADGEEQCGEVGGAALATAWRRGACDCVAARRS